MAANGLFAAATSPHPREGAGCTIEACDVLLQQIERHGKQDHILHQEEHVGTEPAAPGTTKVARRHVGTTLVAHFLEIWEGSLSNGSLISLLRAAATNDAAAATVRSIFGGQVVPMLAPVVPPAEVPVRAGLVATQIMGLAVTRYVLKVPPVVAMDRVQIASLLGPTMQRYVAGKL
jgi:hypothetical protein